MKDIKSIDEQQKLELVFMPSLISILVHLQEKKGSLLTQEEVEEIRDKAVCITVPTEVHEKIEEERGFSDINPDFVWIEWLDYLGILEECLTATKK
ncbi:hypothetical protein [Xenorhabdus mauleonii]|nr:hypothetical protein [Xenorhabdus mauleonii]